MCSERVDLLFEIGVIRCEQMGRKLQPLPAWIVAVESAFEVTGDGRQTALPIRPHAYRIQFERGHAEIMEELPQLRKVLHERRDDLLRRIQFRERVRDDE